MPSWTEFLSEFASKTTSPDDMRQRELRRLHCLTGRICVTSHWPDCDVCRTCPRIIEAG